MAVDLEALFLPSTPLLEIVIRGTVMYLVLFGLLRFGLKREAGTLSLTDLLVIVLLADAAQNAMADDYTSIADGVVLVSVIVFWAYLLDRLGYRFRTVERLVHPPPLALIKDGEIQRRNMRRELVTMEELMSHLRMQGIEQLSEVKRAYVEGNGSISVLRADGNDPPRAGPVDRR